MEYKVPFLCIGKNMKNNRAALSYYISNILSADKFDIESAMPVIKDFIKNDKDVLETNVPAIVRFLGKVGSKRIRKPTDMVKEPTKWFCERLARLLKMIKPADYFLKKLGYAYVKEDICHEWIQAFFLYKGQYKKDLLESMAYAVLDRTNADLHGKLTNSADFYEIFYSLYEKVREPEYMPIPLYLALRSCRRTVEISDWRKFVKTNLSFGRSKEENGACLKRMISIMARRLDNATIERGERQSILDGLRLLADSCESSFLVDCVYKRLKRVESRNEYLSFRNLIKDSDFEKYSKSIHKKVDPKISLFAKAYEHPDNAILYKKLSWKEKVMLYERFDSGRKKEIKNKCLSEFDRYLGFPYYKKELFYMFRILSEDKKFLNKYLHNEKLFSKSLIFSKFRLLYLEKMHAVDDTFLLEHESVYTEDFYGSKINVAIALSPSRNKAGKIMKYRCVIMTIEDTGHLLCEVMTRESNSKHCDYSAVRFHDVSTPRAVYPNINKREALLIAKAILSHKKEGKFAAVLK